MRRRVLAALVGIAGVTMAAALTNETKRGIQSVPAPRAASSDLDIEFYEQRIAEDSFSAADRARLAGLYLQRARETGNAQDYDRAEALARASLELRLVHNGDTYGILTAARLATHDFDGALQSARALFETDPANPSYRAQLAEIELEVGDYESAGRRFADIVRDADNPTVAARLARWYEITGRAELARELLRRTVARLTSITHVPREQIAWFHYRVGELDMRAGRFAGADSAFQQALGVLPHDYRALGALARLSAMREEWTAAIDYGARAIAVQLDPATLGTMSDAYAALGDSAQALSFADAMAASALSQPGSIHRAWGLFLLDHGRDVERVLAEAQAGLAERRDVYAYDLLAWALYKVGRLDEARRAASAALARGTEDAQLLYHAGMITTAAGDSVSGRILLARARALNPRFSVRHARVARSTSVTSSGGT